MGKQKRRISSKHSSGKRNSHNNKSMKKKNNGSYFSDDEEFRSFQKQLEPMGLMIRDVQGDGNCLFRALGDQLDGHDRNHLQHREDTVKYIFEHRNDFEPFMEDGIPFEQHVSNMAQPGTHAGNDALVAFARLHKVVIIIHQLGLPPWQIEGTDEKGARQLHISYHNGEHYASVRKIGDSSEMPTSVQITDCSDDGLCMKEHEDSPEESSPPTESSTDGSDAGLWAPDGTGTRIFGDIAKEEAIKKPNVSNTNSAAPETKIKQKPLTRTQKKDLRRKERRQKQVQKPCSTKEPSEESTVVVSRDLSLLRI